MRSFAFLQHFSSISLAFPLDPLKTIDFLWFSLHFGAHEVTQGKSGSKPCNCRPYLGGFTIYRKKQAPVARAPPLRNVRAGSICEGESKSDAQAHRFGGPDLRLSGHPPALAALPVAILCGTVPIL